jgi:hypothetical protein
MGLAGLLATLLLAAIGNAQDEHVATPKTEEAFRKVELPLSLYPQLDNVPTFGASGFSGGFLVGEPTDD